MRIAIIVVLWGNSWGGSEELWAVTAARALEEGHKVALCIYPGAAEAPRVKELVKKGAQLLVRPYKPAGRLRTALFQFRKAYPRLREWKPDVILVNESSAYTETMAPLNKAFLEVTANVPYVIVPHGNEGWPFPSVDRRAEARAAYSKATWIGAVSESAIRLMSQQLAMPLPNATVICNPVNKNVTAGVPWPADDTVHLAMVGRVDMVKAPDLLFEALADGIWQNRKWQVDMYGGGDHEYYGDVARFYGVADRVVFKGHVSDIGQLWANAHLLAMPSRSEGLPISMVEAMLAGRPTIATDVGGIAEWIIEGKTGFLAEAPKAKYISAALDRAWAVRDQWKGIGAAARELALRKQSGDPAAALLMMLKQAAGVTDHGIESTKAMVTGLAAMSSAVGNSQAL